VPTITPTASLAGQEDAAPDEHLENREETALMTEAVAMLPERERRVILLHYYRGMRLREIAELLTLSDSRVGQLRRQALDRLKRNIRRHSPES
jgi:RNA polymerase sigma factor FliA